MTRSKGATAVDTCGTLFKKMSAGLGQGEGECGIPLRLGMKVHMTWHGNGTQPLLEGFFPQHHTDMHLSDFPKAKETCSPSQVVTQLL